MKPLHATVAAMLALTLFGCGGPQSFVEAGNYALSQSNYPVAEKHFSYAMVGLLKSQDSKDTALLVNALSGLSEAYRSQGKLDEAAAIEKQLLETVKNTPGLQASLSPEQLNRIGKYHRVP